MDGASNTDEVVAATFKVLVLGDSNVGKSSLIKTYCTKTRPSGNTVPTIGMSSGYEHRYELAISLAC